LRTAGDMKYPSFPVWQQRQTVGSAEAGVDLPPVSVAPVKRRGEGIGCIVDSTGRRRRRFIYAFRLGTDQMHVRAV
jgi:hypothetical protein